MKKIFLYVLLSLTIFGCTATNQASTQSSVQTEPAAGSGQTVTEPQAAAELSFAFTRLSGSASNQFAIWIEDSQGRYVKTLYATRWTANGGWQRRPTSIPVWIDRASVSDMSQTQVDAVSAATPRTGNLTYTWDGTDDRGAPVANGDYVIILEGTLRWENQVYYRAPIRLGQGAAASAVSVEYIGDAGNDRAMIGNVAVRVLR